MATKEQKTLLFQAIKNGEDDLVKRLIEDDKIEFENLGEDVFEMSSDCTLLGYVTNLNIMHYFLEKNIKPNLNDISAISFGSKYEKNKIEILDYYLNNYFKDYKEDNRPKNYYDTFGHNYSVAQYLNPNQPLETMMFLNSIKNQNQNLYSYLKPKVKEFDIYQTIPFRWDTIDNCPDEQSYYILEDVVKQLSRKCKDNEVFMEEIKDKKNKDEYLKDIESKNSELREWISFLLDEGFNPFLGCYIKNIYFDIDPFTRLVLNREFELIKKSIELFPENWDDYRDIPTLLIQDSAKDLLKHILSYSGYKSNYYDRKKDPEVYRYDFNPQKRDEIILYLAKNGYPFYKSSLFKFALKENFSYKFDYTTYDIKINNKVFWEVLEKYTPQGDGTTILSDTSFSDAQIEILEKKGYALSKSEQLKELIEKIATMTYVNELVEKAQKIIDSGVKLDDPMQILFKYFWLIEGREDHSKAIKLIVENDLVSKEQFKEFFQKENSAYRTGGSFSGNEKIFQKYCDIKKPLFDKYKDIILSLDFEIQKEYFIYNCDNSEDGYNFIKNNIEEIEKKDIEWDIKYYKSWNLYRGFIKANDEFNLLKDDKFNAYFLKSLLDYNAPKDILQWADKRVNEAIDISDIEVLDKLLYRELNNQLSLQKPTTLNLTDRYKKTLLHKACGYLSVEKINKLLDLGLKVKIEDKYKYTPLDSFLKAKPDIENPEHFKTFKRLLKELIREGGKPTDSIKLIKPKKYKEYQDLLSDYSSIEEELNQESSKEQMKKEAYENELIDITIYKTVAVTSYKRYALKTKIPRKDLNLSSEELAKEFYNNSKEEFDNDWESDEIKSFEIEQ
jgi:hypothetical protein